MNIYEITTKLIGPIEPIGDSSQDEKRLNNLKTTADLVDKLLYDISRVVACKGHYAASINKAGSFAYGFMKDVHDQWEE